MLSGGWMVVMVMVMVVVGGTDPDPFDASLKLPTAKEITKEITINCPPNNCVGIIWHNPN